MKPELHPGSYTLTPIAETGDRFTDFAPYVASLNDQGVVAFQAITKGGGSGVYAGSGRELETIVDPETGLSGDISSHPDINERGSVCFYADLKAGGRGVVLIRNGEVIVVANDTGPLGPTINDDGTVAFRADRGSDGSGIYTGGRAGVTTIAETGDIVSAFHGLPVIDRRGAVAFRADLKAGGQGVYVGDGGSPSPVAETGDVFSDLGRLPIMNDSGTVAFCASLRTGQSGVFTASAGEIATIIDTDSQFETFRGVLINDAGRAIFYATPRGGQLGIFTGPDPVGDCLLSLGGALFGSTIVDFALNPVSINVAAQLAIRVKLANERQYILRADPVE